jgi:hypothetical protein
MGDSFSLATCIAEHAKRSTEAARFLAELGKHPDFSVGPPTATVFPTNDRKFKISQFFAKNFETV